MPSAVVVVMNFAEYPSTFSLSIFNGGRILFCAVGGVGRKNPLSALCHDLDVEKKFLTEVGFEPTPEDWCLKPAP